MESRKKDTGTSPGWTRNKNRQSTDLLDDGEEEASQECRGRLCRANPDPRRYGWSRLVDKRKTTRIREGREDGTVSVLTSRIRDRRALVPVPPLTPT